MPVAQTGGAARHVLDAARTGVPGWRLVMLCPPGPLADALRAGGAAVLTGPVSPADGAATATRTVRRVLARLAPDVLHTHLAFADLVGAAAVTGLRSGRGERIRVVSTEHGISGVPGLYRPGALASRGRLLAHRARQHRTDAVIAVSESTRTQVRAQWGDAAPITVIRNAVDAPACAPRVVPGLRILSLARLAPEKRIDRTLDAFARVRRSHPEARLTLAGEGPEQAALRRRVASLGCADAVAFPGHVDAGAALGAHDVVVQLSAWENLSYTLLDAAAHGLGVVASDVGGNREAVPARCLVDPGDGDAVARAIVAQGLDPAARPGGATAGAPTSVADMCRAIAAVYAQVMR